MIKTLQILGMLLVLVVGVLSLLATVPSSDSFSIATVNDRQENSGEAILYACLNEQIELRWNLYVSGTATLNAVPSDAFEPKLENKSIRDEGSLNLGFLKPSKLSVKLSDNTREYTFEQLSDEICTGFPVQPVVGAYKGTLKQTSPQAATLESDLQFIWIGDKLHARVDFRPAFPCTFDTTTDQIICIEGDQATPTFKLKGTFVKDHFEGSYQGLGETVAGQTSFAGTFVFAKPTP